MVSRFLAILSAVLVVLMAGPASAGYQVLLTYAVSDTASNTWTATVSADNLTPGVYGSVSLYNFKNDLQTTVENNKFTNDTYYVSDAGTDKIIFSTTLTTPYLFRDEGVLKEYLQIVAIESITVLGQTVLAYKQEHWYENSYTSHGLLTYDWLVLGSDMGSPFLIWAKSEDYSTDGKTNLPHTFVLSAMDIHSVPLPGAVYLFGSALAGLIGLRRFRSS